MMSQQITVIPILPNISRGKSNQTMKVSQRIEYNKRNSFLEKSYTKCGGEASPRPFHEKSKLSISGSIVWNVKQFAIACPKEVLPKLY